MNDILYYVVNFLLQIVAFLFVVRFLLQLCRADFYNPISQGVVKATDLALKPLRLVLPGYRNLDIAALVAAIAVEAVLILALSTIAGQYAGGAIQILLGGVLRVLLLGLEIIKWSILIVIVASFIAPGSRHPALALLHQLTEPVLAPARRLIPPLGGLDFSPILVFLLLGIVERVLMQI